LIFNLPQEAPVAIFRHLGAHNGLCESPSMADRLVLAQETPIFPAPCLEAIPNKPIYAEVGKPNPPKSPSVRFNDPPPTHKMGVGDLCMVARGPPKYSRIAAVTPNRPLPTFL